MTIKVSIKDKYVVVKTKDPVTYFTVEEADKLAAEIRDASNGIKTNTAKDLKKLGEILLDRLIDAVYKAEGFERDGKHWVTSPLCCTPFTAGRDEPCMMKGKVMFWINTGRSTQLDGWKSKEEIEAYIKSPTKLVDKMRD
jgi:hypothetical protein